MPAKRSKTTPLDEAKKPTEPSSLTVENFEKELQALAAKARQQSPVKFFAKQVAVLAKAAAVITCAAAYSNVSLLTMSPVYGAIPASIRHPQLVITACFVGWSGSAWLKRLLPKRPLCLLPLISCYIPMIQYFLFQFSDHLGAVYGPALTELVTFVPLLIVSVSSVSIILEDLDLSILGKNVEEAGPGIGSYIFFRVAEFFSKSLMQRIMGANIFGTRLGLQILLMGLYSGLAPSKLLYFGAPGLYHLAFHNRHLQTPWANFDLSRELNMAQGFKVLDRHESATGYLSVIQGTENFRVLRCDHSLLGGEWIEDGAVNEPIYGVFAMLEAVRLIEVQDPLPNKNARALVVGLGTGSTPSALIRHGINTTIIEIDPVVYQYAIKYFALPENHTAVIADAVGYLEQLAKAGQYYDYVVHDVFTGGAEPEDLFTREFLQDLYSVLKPHGAIAINYAGDLALPSARLVVRTIKAVFPSCRIYRENEPPSGLAQGAGDFTNMVVFCSKSESPISFRQPTEADYLGSHMRRIFLKPVHEIDADAFAEDRDDDAPILSRGDTQKLFKWQRQSAIGHWSVMRTVLPSAVWENW